MQTMARLKRTNQYGTFQKSKEDNANSNGNKLLESGKMHHVPGWEESMSSTCTYYQKH